MYKPFKLQPVERQPSAFTSPPSVTVTYTSYCHYVAPTCCPRIPAPPLPPQVLASPTTKDFTNVMMFLFRQLDPVLPKQFKLEEEVRPCAHGSLGALTSCPCVWMNHASHAHPEARHVCVLCSMWAATWCLSSLHAFSLRVLGTCAAASPRSCLPPRRRRCPSCTSGSSTPSRSASLTCQQWARRTLGPHCWLR